MASHPDLSSSSRWQPLRSGILLVALVMLLGVLTAAGLGAAVLAGAALLDRALG